MPDCRTRYPILLIHGLNRRDDCGPSYWGRVPDILRAQGPEYISAGRTPWAALRTTPWPCAAGRGKS